MCCPLLSAAADTMGNSSGDGDLMYVSLRRKESEGSVAGWTGGRVWRHQETGEGYRKPVEGRIQAEVQEAEVRGTTLDLMM